MMASSPRRSARSAALPRGLRDVDFLPGDALREVLSFPDRQSARAFLLSLKRDPMQLSSMRALARRRGGLAGHSTEDDAVIEHLAILLASGDVVVVRPPSAGLAGIGQLQSKPEELKKGPPPPPSPAPRLGFLEIELMGEDGRPIPRKKFKVIRPGGALVREGTLNGSGFARIDGIEEGAYQVAFPDLE